MASVDTSNNWEKIQQGVKETERLMGQRHYNLSMIKARQTLEYMVRCLGERACIVDGDLNSTIDELFEAHYINKTTCEHYHKIRILGNKAIHEGDENAYDANQAYHLLSQEVYTFANDYSQNRKRRNSSASGSASHIRSGRNTGSHSRKRPEGNNRGFQLNAHSILGLLIAILCILLLVAIIRFMKPSKGSAKTEASTAVETIAETLETTATDISPEETSATASIYRATETLNVRSDPSTDHDRIGQIAPGTEVEYVGAYDDKWAVILYKGEQAYVASQYLSVE